MEPLRVCLLGSKFMGRAHANAWGQANRFFDLARRVRLELAVARDASALSSFAERFGFARHGTDWRPAVVDPAVDLVDVATPNDLHAEPAIAALEAGKHVACEKPLAATLAEARAMRDAARRHRRARTFVWFNYRRCPAVGLARKLIQEGRLGRLFHVRARYLQDWGGKDTPLLWRFKKSAAGSGAHGDLNAHLIDLARFLTGDEVGEVHGAVSRTFFLERDIPGTKRRGKSDVDDATSFLATLKGGAIASFEASRVAPGHQNDNAIEICGEGGSLRFAFEDMNLLWFCDAGADPRTAGWTRVLATDGAHHPWVAAWWPKAHLLGYEHGFVNMAADVVRVLSGAEPEAPLPDFEDAYQTQRVLEAATLAARERRPVRLAEVK